ncbi:MAG: polysaccharide deacetylase family protein [Chlamydiota bacterium]|nr:polysaccharide deacetylase family protein [Chlamydiota bacterium]
MIKQIKELIWFLAVCCGFHYLFKRFNNGKYLILMYHGVSSDSITPLSWSQVSINHFIWQMSFLKKHYQIFSLEEVIKKIKTGIELPKNTAVITFDDGFRNNYTIAYPILKQLSIPATIFLTTYFVDTKEIIWPDSLYLTIFHTKQTSLNLKMFGLGAFMLNSASLKEEAWQNLKKRLKEYSSEEKDRIFHEILNQLKSTEIKENIINDASILTWEQIKEMHQSKLIDFGAHSVHHEILSKLNPDIMEKEIIDSCKTVQEKLKTQIISFAYPNGRPDDFTEKSKEILKSYGALCAVTTIKGLNSLNEDLFALKRISIGQSVSRNRFRLLITGFIYWIEDLFKNHHQ